MPHPLPPHHLHLLTTICNLPTAPFCEEHVSRWLQSWATRLNLRHWTDPARNLYVEYRRGPARSAPLLIEAHMDHPGFLSAASTRTTLRAEFRGGVKPSFFPNARTRFLVDSPAGPRWIKAKVASVKPRKNSRVLDVRLTSSEKIPPNSLGMWDLPAPTVTGDLFAAPVCDDLAGVAAIVCLLEELARTKPAAHVIAMFDRGEEVGFAGVLAACQHNDLPKSARVIGLETSKASPNAKQGDGVVIRVGDRTGIFSPGLTHFLSQCAGFLADDDPAFKSQRRLMDAGMCNSTAFLAYGFDSAALCLPLGNYHNMSIKGDAGHDQPVPKAAKSLASETIHLHDFHNMVQLLLKTVERYPKYKGNFSEVKNRLQKMHKEEQAQMLKTTATRLTP